MDKYKSKGEPDRKDNKRSRSRSPKRKHNHDRYEDYSSRDRRRKDYSSRRDERRRSRSSRSSSSSSKSDDDSRYKKSKKHSTQSSAPPAPKISLDFNTGSSTKSSSSFKKPGGVSMKLNVPAANSTQPKKLTVANAFNNDSDEEVEEMPAECKMRMKNVGRFTPTSSGPNSYGKTKMGFVDTKKMFEKKMQEMLKDMGE